MIPPARLSLTREGWYYLLIVGLIFGAAMLRGVNLMLLLGGLLLGPLVLSLWALWRSASGLRAARRVPQGICAGDLLLATITLSKAPRRWGAWSVVVEDLIERVSAQKDQRPLRPAVLFPYVAAGHSHKAAYRGRLLRRGRYRLGPLRVSTAFPFGLLVGRFTCAERHTLLVYPRLGRLRRDWAARRREAFTGVHQREPRAGADGDFFGTRPWQQGDSLRQVHWRASARRGELVVRQREQPRHRDVAVVLALGRSKRPSASKKHEEEVAVERAVSFAATVVSELCRQGGGKVHLATFAGGRAECLGGPASPAVLQDLMERLAVVEPEHDDHLGELLKLALGQAGPGTEIVVVSTRAIDPAEAGRLLEAANHRAQRRLARSIRWVNAAGSQIDQYFEWEPDAALGAGQASTRG